MLYHYKNRLWTLKVQTRESTFELMKEHSPNFYVIIVDREHPHEETHAKAGDLTNYSVQRNLNALKKGGDYE